MLHQFGRLDGQRHREVFRCMKLPPVSFVDKPSDQHSQLGERGFLIVHKDRQASGMRQLLGSLTHATRAINPYASLVASCNQAMTPTVVMPTALSLARRLRPSSLIPHLSSFIASPAPHTR